MSNTPALLGIPVCRCGARNSDRVGESALMRQCRSCGETFSYRIQDGHLVPFSPLTALALDEQRALRRAS
jgi:hypothetical protein